MISSSFRHSGSGLQAERSNMIPSASKKLKSAGSSRSTLSTDDGDDHLSCMPRNLPSMLERRHSLPNLTKDGLAARESPKYRTSPKSMSPLAKLSLQGREARRPYKKQIDGTRNVALIRWILHDARERHGQRSSYQARQQDTRTNSKSGFRSIIFREVVNDVLASARKCCKAYRACQYLSKAVVKPGKLKWELEPHLKLNTSLPTHKAFTVGVLCKMLQDVREKNADTEAFWMACFDGLASKSVTSKNFGNRSTALRSCRSELSMHGSASLGMHGSASLGCAVFAPA